MDASILHSASYLANGCIYVASVVRRENLAIIGISRRDRSEEAHRPIFFIIIFFINLSNFRRFNACVFNLRARFFDCSVGYFHVRALIGKGRSASARADASGLHREGIRRINGIVNDRGLHRLRRLTFRFFLFRRFIFALLSNVTFITAMLNAFVVLVSLINRANRNFLCLLLCVFLTSFHLRQLT